MISVILASTRVQRVSWVLEGATEDASDVPAATSEPRGVAWEWGEGHDTANIEVEGVVKEVEKQEGTTLWYNLCLHVFRVSDVKTRQSTTALTLTAQYLSPPNSTCSVWPQGTKVQRGS